MDKKTVLRIIAVWLFCAALLVAISPLMEAESIYQNVIRIHVLANSDSEEDQRLKLLVRDAVLKYAGENFTDFTDIQQAKAVVNGNLEQIKKIAESVLRENNSYDSVSVSLGNEYYTTREYEEFRMPAGDYLSLKIMIGDAAGKNWWCVLFPPICLDSATSSEDALVKAGVSEEGAKMVEINSSKYEVKFKIVEAYHSLKNSFKSFFNM